MPGLGLLLRKYAPHDTYTIWKVGNKLRVDGSLMGIDTKSLVPEWKRGHFSLVVDGSPEGMAAAATAAEQAVAAARQAALSKKQRHKQQQGTQLPLMQHLQQPGVEGTTAGELMQQSFTGTGSRSGPTSPAPAPATPPSSCITEAAAQSTVHDNGTALGDAAAQQPASPAASISTSSTRTCQQVGVGNKSNNTGVKFQGQQEQQQEQQQEFYDPEPGPPGGPRLLFINHTKGNWVDLSADKKALKLELDTEQEEMTDLVAAMER